MVNFVFGISGEDQIPLLQELWKDYGGANIAIPKDMSERMIVHILQELFRKNRALKSCTHIAATRNGSTRLFAISEILYVESRRNHICFVTEQEVFEVYGSLREIEHIFARLGFLRIHGSFLISLLHIREYNARFVRMSDQTQINIGRRYLGQFRTAIKERPAIYFVN